MGWIPYAVKCGERLIRERQVDVIYASAMPVSAFFVGAILSRRTGRPWVAEYRDAWTTNFWATRPRGVQQIEEMIERWLLKSASAIVTVSDPLAQDLMRLHGRPVEVIPHGYDEECYTSGLPLTARPTITYTGTMNPRRDPSPLFAALAELKQQGSLDPELRVRFFGRGGEMFIQAAERYSLPSIVYVEGEVPSAHMPRIQQESTILLLLETTDPAGAIMMTHKLGEYLGARRPILAFGPRGGAIEQVLKETGAGVLVTNAAEAAAVLAEWFRRYREGDPNMGLVFNEEALRRYTHRHRAQQVAGLLDRIVSRKQGVTS